MIDQGITAALAARDALRSTKGDDSHNSGTGIRRTERATRECTYTDFLKCQPLPFKGTEGVASLSQWCKRMESIFHISNCAAENQVKFATCTLHSVALTWWNTHELDLLCGRMFSEESNKIEKYVRGLPNMIHGSVVTSKPKTMQEAIEIATELMDKKIRTFVERETTSKRNFENTSRNTQNQQQQHLNKRTNNNTRTRGRTPAEFKPRHLVKRSNMSAANTNNANNQRGTGSGQKSGCYECGIQGHFKRECPKLKNNNNQGNQSGRNNAPARVYAVGRAGTDPDANVGNKTLIIHGDGSNRGNATRLSIISFTKTEKYVKKGFPIFLAHITTKEVEDKSKKKRLEDVPIVRDFPEVFREDLPSLPPIRPVEFQIDLVPGAAPVARVPYRLTPFEMKELAE
nr:reverse transcriptase domain-containing protein [Tanacetum cinerariifolium]